jgi:RNA polymerase sigma-70 factor, ECF subfamily
LRVDDRSATRPATGWGAATGAGLADAALAEPTPAASSRVAIEAMVRYCDGDPGAFRALYAIAAPRLLGYLRCLVRDQALAEELLQQTFLKLHQARASYLAGADPLPWLYTIAHRICLDEFRRAGRARVSVSPGGEPTEPVATFAGASETAQPTYREATIEAVLRALEQLPTNLRDAVVLTKIQGHSVAEAAAMLGTTPTAVKLRAHRGYVKLRAWMRDHGEAEWATAGRPSTTLSPSSPPSPRLRPARR